MEYYIKSVKFTKDENGEREVHVQLNHDTLVKICECYESYQQYNACTPALWVSLPVAEACNDWLHGENKPDEEIIHDIIVSAAVSFIKENPYEVFDKIDNFSTRRDLALDMIDKYRCSFYHADSDLYDEMYDALEEWCNDEDELDIEDFEIENLIF
jgi:hypothetical protein